MSIVVEPGVIRDEIKRVLSISGEPMSPQAIQHGIEASLGRAVASSSVRSYLLNNEPTKFIRVDRGLYALATSFVGNSPKLDTFESSKFGKSTLVHADCLSWLRAQAENSIDAVVTDPPYGPEEYSEVSQQKLRNGKGGNWRIPPSLDGAIRSPVPRFTTADADDREALKTFFTQWGSAMLRVLKPGAHVFVASNPLFSHLVGTALAESGLERRGEVVRMVMTLRGGDRPKNAHDEFRDITVMPRSMWEPWLLFRKPLEGTVAHNLRTWGTGGLRRASEERPFGDVIQSAPTNASEKKLANHPSLKPQAFLRTLVRAALPFDDGVLLDPFAGSGSTLAAANALGLSSIGLERDESYYSLAKDAIPRLTAYSPRSSSN
ncbi:DNA-methyltransferase [Arthrobacter sp. TMN-49]